MHSLLNRRGTICCHTHHAQVTQEPVPFSGLRETPKMTICAIVGIDLSQDTGQEPGSADEQHKQPWRGCLQAQSQPGQVQLWHPVGRVDREIQRLRSGMGPSGIVDRGRESEGCRWEEQSMGRREAVRRGETRVPKYLNHSEAARDYYLEVDRVTVAFGFQTAG